MTSAGGRGFELPHRYKRPVRIAEGTTVRYPRRRLVCRCPAGGRFSLRAVGEIRRGVERIRRRDARSARVLEAWLRRVVAEHSDRILPIDDAVAEEWGRLNVPDPIPVIDGLMAATARVHGLTLATRNLKDIKRTGAACVNPFAG